jgi:hypothetical protein
MMDRRILTWQFFANRFDTLISEMQTAYDMKSDVKKKNLATSAETASVASVGHTSLRARRQKSGGEVSVRSLAASLKYPYKRTISAPAGMGLSVSSKVVF